MSEGDTENVLYFAFGANMAHRVFVERRGMAPRRAVAGFLEDYALVFDHSGLPIFDEAFANLKPVAGARVWGVLYEITPDNMETLDRLEGGGAYDHQMVTVETSGGSREQAVAYISEGRTEGLRPSRRYRDLLVAGARERDLPPDWVDQLAAIPASATWVPGWLAERIPVIAGRLFRLGVPLVLFVRPYWALRACLWSARPTSNTATAAADTAATTKGQDG